ncbi:MULTISPECIES: hypothetical protein [Paenibacillus]|uniref:hypothetical protein n=1 Tax=Paenibacillus TaxID=44249 RepID=UPI00020D6CB9|nr:MULTISPECIES: hypothetical protein [Paenibacillus]EGL20118.1 hypothetical protein HMPREF9413_5604 [Paenibacillus sp. HGF7]MBV6714246.1 hypothetical protein [Paenibacillus chitinolyticus]
MNEQQARKWSVMRRKGPGMYVMLNFALPVGLVLTALVSLLEYSLTGELIGIWLPIRLIVFCFIGFFIGMFRWQTVDKRYQQVAPKYGLPVQVEKGTK